MKFTYTKSNGDISVRNLVAIRRPSNNYFGIDVTDLNPEVIAELEMFLHDQKDVLAVKIRELNLANRYRTFLKEGVSFDKMDL